MVPSPPVLGHTIVSKWGHRAWAQEIELSYKIVACGATAMKNLDLGFTISRMILGTVPVFFLHWLIARNNG